MSILLDALKRSEEQRRLGSMPDIHSPVSDDAASGVSGHLWIPVVLVVFSAITIAWFGWQQFRQPDTLAGTESTSPSAESAAVADGSGVTGGTTAGSDAGVAMEDGKADPAVAGRAAPAVDTAGTQPAATATPDSGAAGAQSGPESSAEVRKSRVNQSYTGFEAPEEAPAAQPPRAVAETPPPEAAPPEGAGSAAAPGREKSRVTEPITFWELPQGVRDSLPELRITVLVYAEKPERRFVLIGGQRLVEKDEIQDGVVLDEIRRDGAVFVYRNYRFLVKG